MSVQRVVCFGKILKRVGNPHGEPVHFTHRPSSCIYVYGRIFQPPLFSILLEKLSSNQNALDSPESGIAIRFELTILTF